MTSRLATPPVSPRWLLSNGDLNFAGSNGTGTITVEAGASLYSEGSLVFATNGQSTIDSTAHFGSKNIGLAVSTINIGDSADIAAAGVNSGLLFNQALFNTLVSGDPLNGAPALQSITLGASSSINLYGTASLDATRHRSRSRTQYAGDLRLR